MDGLPRLHNDIRTRGLFVVLFVLVFLTLAAIFAQPARADLIDAASAVIDQASDVVEDTTSTVIDNGAPGAEDDATSPVEEIVVEVIPPVGEEVVEVLEDVPPIIEEAGEVDAVSPVLDDLPSVVEDVAPVAEDLLAVVDEAAPVIEDVSVVVADVLPIVETVEVQPAFDEIVLFVPPLEVDMILVLPMLVFDAVQPIDVGTDRVISTDSKQSEVIPASELTTGQSYQSSGLFTKELVAEMAQFQLDHLKDGSATSSSSSQDSDRETPSLAPYVPIAGTMPAVGSAGGSASSGSSHSGSSFFGGVDASGLIAALAALLALCLVGWVRDHSRSGRSIFPSHEGRPG